MFVQPDLSIYTILSTGFANLRTAPAPLSDIFAGHSDAIIAETQQYFSETVTPVRLGYPKQVNEVGIGAIYITLAASQEVQPQQFLSSDAPLDLDESALDAREGSLFQSTTRVSCLSSNVNKTIFLATICRYILLGNRDPLETDYNLMEQVISTGDLAPYTVFQPDFVFQRVITHTCKHLDTVNTTIAQTIGGTLKQIDLTPEPNGVLEDTYSIT